MPDIQTGQSSSQASVNGATSTPQLPSINPVKDLVAQPRGDGASAELADEGQVSSTTDEQCSPPQEAVAVAAYSTLVTAAVIGGGTPDRLPKLSPKDNSLTARTNGDSNDTSAAPTTHAQEPSELEKRLDAMLKKGGALNNGMKPGAHSGTKGGRKGGRKATSKRGPGGGGGGLSGGRPLGDIVSPRRMQELLLHEDDRTLPYTYYRTAVDGQEPAVHSARPNPPQ